MTSDYCMVSWPWQVSGLPNQPQSMMTSYISNDYQDNDLCVARFITEQGNRYY